MGLLDNNDIDFISACLDEIASDVDEPITFKRYIGKIAGDQVMGTSDQYQYNDLDILATVRELTLEEIQVSGGMYEYGDMEFKIRQKELTNKPEYADRIVYGSAAYKPKSIKHIHLGGIIGWTIRAGKV